eukprot:Gb_10368 [translate_table: standard]
MSSYEEEFCAAITRIALSGDGLVLGFGLAVVAVKTLYKYHWHAKALKKLQETPVTHISDLRSLVSEHNGDKGALFTERAHGSSKPANEPFVVVRGNVQTKPFTENNGRNSADNVLMARNSGVQAVIVETTQRCLYSEWRGLFCWSSDWQAFFRGSLREQVTNSVRKVPFVLVQKDGLRCLNHVNITLDESKHPLPLTTVYHQLHPVQASPCTVFQAIFGTGYPVGLLDQEKVLLPGKEITAIGHLSFTDDGHLVIKPCEWLPYFLSDFSKSQLVTDIASGTKVLFWTGIVLSTAAVGVLSYAALRNWHRWKEWRHRSQGHHSTQVSTVTDQMDDESEDWPDVDLCVVCFSRQRRYAFIPCGHLACCSRCSQMVEHLESNPRCPICRQHVHESIRIYNS